MHYPFERISETTHGVALMSARSSVSWARGCSFWSALLGHFFDHYDTALFGVLSPFLAPLLFPDQSPVMALILTFAMIPLGMLIRPAGSLLFGYLGDRYGRRSTFSLTLAGMGIVSLLMAFIPSYDTLGIAAPLLFFIGRLLQNFFSAGETMGGAIFLLEQAPPTKHDLISSIYNAITIAGILGASAGASLCAYFGNIADNWRVLYLIGALAALFGWVLRLSSPKVALTASLPTFSFSWRSLVSLLWNNLSPLTKIALGAGLGYANYVMALVFFNAFVPLVAPFSTDEMTHLNTFLLIFDFALLPCCGLLAAKIHRENLMRYSALAIALLAIPLSMLLENASWTTVILVRSTFVFLGVSFFAPFHAWARGLVDERHRYLLISFGYSLGTQLFGSPAATVSMWLFHKTGWVASLSWYWMLLALVVTGTLWKSKAFFFRTTPHQAWQHSE